MKALKLVPLFLIAFLFCNSTVVAQEEEDDLLDKAWGLEPDSRLSCQAKVGTVDLVVEIPKYTINMESENH